MPAFLTSTEQFLLITLTTISINLFWGLGSISLVVYGLLIVYGVIFIALNFKKLQIVRGPAFYLACAYYVYFILASVINQNILKTGPSIIQFFLITIVAFAGISINQIKDVIHKLAKIFTVVGIFVAVMSYVIPAVTYYYPEVVSRLPFGLDESFVWIMGGFPGRADGLIGNANFTSNYMNICAFFSIYLLTTSRDKKWITLSIIDILLAIYVVFILCNSRTSMIVFMCFCFFYACFYYLYAYKEDKNKRKHFYFILGAIAILVLLMILIVAFSPSVKDYVFNKLLRVSSLKDGTGRLGIFKTALELGEGRRLFGFNYLELRAATPGNNSHAHNSFLEILSFGGIPAFVFFTCYFFYSIYIALRNVFTKATVSSEYNLMFILLLCLVLAFFASTMTEADIDRMRLSTACLQMELGFIHVINYQLKKQAKLN